MLTGGITMGIYWQLHRTASRNNVEICKHFCLKITRKDVNSVKMQCVSNEEQTLHIGRASQMDHAISVRGFGGQLKICLFAIYSIFQE